MPWSKMADLELSDEDKLDMMSCMPSLSNQPDYPYGLRIVLTETELEKLGLKPDCEVGEVIDMRAFGVVTSVSTEKRDGKDSARVEIQIQRLAIEDESADEPGDDDE